MPVHDATTGDARGDVECLGNATASTSLPAFDIAIAGTIVLLVGFLVSSPGLKPRDSHRLHRSAHWPSRVCRFLLLRPAIAEVSTG